MRLPVVVLAVLTFSFLTACSSDDKSSSDAPVSAATEQQQIDDAWTSGLEEAGVKDADLAAIQEQTAADCQIASEAGWILALAVSPRTVEPVETAVGLELMCPDVSETFKAAQAKIDKAADPKALACTLPTKDLDMTQQATLEMVC